MRTHILCIIFLQSISLCLALNIIYVNHAVSGGDGSNWGQAFDNLQDALNIAVSGNQIWVAKGTYKPSAKVGGTGDRYKTFQMKNGVAIYGGFAGNEQNTFDLNNRNFETNETILSADLLDNDAPGLTDDELLFDTSRSDNCYYVVIAGSLSPDTTLDGFTITAANNTTFNNQGGGIIIYNSDITVSNCIFFSNSTDYGGGIYNKNSNTVITNCTFTSNFADWGGGGMVNIDSNPIITNCNFIGNSTGLYGGGIFFSGAIDTNQIVNNCIFSNNTAGLGGAIEINIGNRLTVTNSTFYANSAILGGGIENQSELNSTFSNCGFIDNSADDAGAIAIAGNNSLVVNCFFAANSADRGGGALCNYGNPTIANCTFVGNFADIGGAMFNGPAGGPVSPTQRAFSAILSNENNAPVLSNCILWNNNANSGNEIYNDETCNPEISFCNIAGSGGSGAWDPNIGTDLGGNIDVNPLFIDPNGIDSILGTEDDNLQLSIGSPCIDAGDNSAVSEPNDLDDHPRIIDGDCSGTATVDMGAYEFNWLYMGDFEGNDCDVDLGDFSVLSQNWQQNNPLIDIDLNGIIDMGELLIVTEHWLATIE